MTLFGMIASAVGAVFSGGVLKIIIDRFSMTRNEQYQAVILLVEQLQRNVNENNDKILELEKQVTMWREKYYIELDEKNKLSTEVRQLRLELQKFNKNHTA